MQTQSTISCRALALFSILLVSSVLGHSQMRCAKYDKATGKCYAPIRNQGPSFDEEGNDMTSGGGVCQSRMSNPISASYSNGKACPDYSPCPLPMGTIQQGENFTIMWLARNHATADQTPGNIALYVSPVESENQGLDVSTSVFGQNKICEAPFISCDGQNGNMVQCYATCKMPTNTVVGIHTLWWKWAWLGHTSIYTTCADIYVTAMSGSSSNTPTPTVAPPTQAQTTGAMRPLTTAAEPVIPVTPVPVPVTPVPVPVTPVPVPVTPVPVPVTPVPVTPAKPSTTAQPVMATTGAQMQTPSTPAKPVTTGAVPVVVPPTNNENCASASIVSSSRANIATVDSWGNQFHGVININVDEHMLSNWVLEVTWPASTSINVVRYFNAGSLQCEGTRTSYFTPAATWANNLPSGSMITVEFVATNPDKMDSLAILANTQVRVLKRN